MSQRTILVVGGTSGIGLEIAKEVVARGDNVILTGRDQERAEAVAASVGPNAQGLAVDISEPERSPRASGRSSRSTASSSPRSSATRTRCASTTSPAPAVS